MHIPILERHPNAELIITTGSHSLSSSVDHGIIAQTAVKQFSTVCAERDGRQILGACKDPSLSLPYTNRLYMVTWVLK